MMKKRNIQYLFAATLLLAGMTMLSSCSSDDDSSKGNSETEEVTWEEPTTDQMEVCVTNNLPAASLSQFDELSTGAAFLKRLPRVTASIESDTEIVLLKGSDVSTQSEQTVLEMARVLLFDGYVALETPTAQQLDIFMNRIMKGMAIIVADSIDNYFYLTPEQAEASVRASMVGRMETRRSNISNLTRGTADDEVEAELMIFGCEDVFFQEPISKVAAASVFDTDIEGNLLTDGQSVTYDQSNMTAYRYGLYADGAAQWIIDTEAEKAALEQEASQSPSRRADSQAAINNAMSASETFTHYGNIAYTNELNHPTFKIQACRIILRSWSAHNMTNNKDYYYISENVQLSLGQGKESKSDMFFSRKIGGDWRKGFTPTDKFGKYDLALGNFLWKYTTSMNLSGSGFVKLEAATPETANQTVTEQVSMANSNSETNGNGVVANVTVGFTSKAFTANASAGYKHKHSTTSSTTFDMANTRSIKGLSVVKNTEGNKVTWINTGLVPEVMGSKNDWQHELISDILVNDANLVNDACWSVGSPSGHYKLTVESEPVMGILLLQNSSTEKMVHQTKTKTEQYVHELLMPSRFTQTWRMFLVVDEWDTQGYSPKLHTQLEDNIRSTFPDVYKDVYTVAETIPSSLDMSSVIMGKAFSIFSSHRNVLADLARSNGVKKFTIHWRCDDTKVKVRNGFVVRAN